MRYLVAVLLFTSVAVGQAAKPKKPCATLAKCRAELTSMQSDLTQATDMLADSTSDGLKSAAEITELKAKNADLEKKLGEMRATAIEVLKFNAKLQEEYFKSIQQQNETAEKYNDLLSSARQSIDSANDRLARQYRVNNALMMYSMMPKVQPYVLPQTPIVLPPPAPQSRCVATTLGNQTYTNCN